MSAQVDMQNTCGDTNISNRCFKSKSGEHYAISGELRSGGILEEPRVSNPNPEKARMSGSLIAEMTKKFSTRDQEASSPKRYINGGGGGSVPNVHKKYTKRRTPNSCHDVNLSGYTLKTKDSLVDVAACLNEKRNEVLKIWEHNLPQSDSTLLVDLEKANELALDAARDVETLRKSIQNLQKSTHITEQNTNELDNLRNRIISKLQHFEETHSNIQNRLRAVKSLSSTSKTENRESQTNIRRSRKSKSDKSLNPESSKGSKNKSSTVFLKERTQMFLEDDETENELESFDSKGMYEGHVLNKSRSKTSDVLQVESLEDLSKLYQFYTQKTFSLEPLKEVSEMSEYSVHNYDHGPTHKQHKSRKNKGHDHECIYRDKINSMHQKLMDQETKYEDLSRHVQRIESQSGFDIKMLKSGIKERLDDLEPLPELLHITEKRLNDTIQVQHFLETNLQLKIQELTNAYKEVQKLSAELAETKQKLEPHVVEINSLRVKNYEIESLNNALRTELEKCKDHARRLEKKVSQKVNTHERPHSRTNANLLMEDRIAELERELAKEKQRSAILRDARDNISAQMTRRQEELMENLEEARRKNKTLQNQILFIKSSYQNIFPKDMFLQSSLIQEIPVRKLVEQEQREG